MRRRLPWAIGATFAIATLALVALPPAQVVVGSYRTPFGGRSEHQRLNGHEIDDVARMLPDFGLECRGRDARFQQHVIVAEKL